MLKRFEPTLLHWTKIFTTTDKKCQRLCVQVRIQCGLLQCEIWNKSCKHQGHSRKTESIVVPWINLPFHLHLHTQALNKHTHCVWPTNVWYNLRLLPLLRLTPTNSYNRWVSVLQQSSCKCACMCVWSCGVACKNVWSNMQSIGMNTHTHK